MAIFKSTLLGEVHKSAGNVTMCNIRGRNVAKAKIFNRKDTTTPEILKQRSRFAFLSKLSSLFLEAIRKGFPENRGAQACNRFISLNHAQVSVDEEGNSTIDPKEIRCAAGKVRPPHLSVVYDSNREEFVFMQEAEGVDGRYCRPDDKVYAVLYDSSLDRSRLLQLEERGDGGETLYPLPEDWRPEYVHIWSFATDRCGSAASESCYTEVEER